MARRRRLGWLGHAGDQAWVCDRVRPTAIRTSKACVRVLVRGRAGARERVLYESAGAARVRGVLVRELACVPVIAKTAGAKPWCPQGVRSWIGVCAS